MPAARGSNVALWIPRLSYQVLNLVDLTDWATTSACFSKQLGLVFGLAWHWVDVGWLSGSRYARLLVLTVLALALGAGPVGKSGCTLLEEAAVAAPAGQVRWLLVFSYLSYVVFN